jgi:hypothetical protein
MSKSKRSKKDPIRHALESLASSNPELLRAFIEFIMPENIGLPIESLIDRLIVAADDKDWRARVEHRLLKAREVLRDVEQEREQK